MRNWVAEGWGYEGLGGGQGAGGDGNEGLGGGGLGTGWCSSTGFETRGCSACCFQRLELMGDAALGLIITNLLFLAYPGLNAGDLPLYSANISTDKLACVTVHHDLCFLRRSLPALDIKVCLQIFFYCFFPFFVSSSFYNYMVWIEQVKEFAEAFKDEDEEIVYNGAIEALIPSFKQTF